jgi:hypothetical protein
LSARIVAAQRFLSRILDSFLAFVVSLPSKLGTPFKKIVNRIAPKDDTEKEGTGSQLQSPVVSKVVPSPPSDEKTKKTVHIYTPWWKTLLEFAAVGTVMWYTFEAHQANTISTNSMKQSQRPWIGPYRQVPLITGPIIIDGMGIRVDYRMSAVNYGSFGANNVNFWAQLYVAQDISTIQQRAKYACENSTSNPDMGRVLFPGQDTAMLNAWPALAMDIIPNKNANPPQTQYRAYLLACIGYRDQFGIPHHTGTIYRSVHPANGETIMFELTKGQSIPVEWRDWHSFLD